MSQFGMSCIFEGKVVFDFEREADVNFKTMVG